MARPERANEELIQIALDNLPLWKRKDETFEKEIVASNFAGIIGVVNSIALISETMDHHPNLLIYGWNKLKITLTTHDLGGLTRLDFELAKKIDDLNF
ncbi:MAG: 4a-hydroxytetrahydrobiopterin dehydratase [Candidatus Kapabacteria bacterium]|nr:4a-hydroxytetrahydrobiopterin dehydratase [Candidatus Kapabacteria bacterium]